MSSLPMLTDSQVENSVRAVREALVETYILGANTDVPKKIVLFGDQQNSGQATAYPERTNLSQATTLPHPESLELYRIKVNFVGMLAKDVISFCQKYVMRLYVSGTRRGTFYLTPSDQPRVIATIATDVLTHSTVTIDLPEEFKIDIVSGKPFRVEFESSVGFTTVNSSGLGIFMRVELDGVHGLAI